MIVMPFYDYLCDKCDFSLSLLQKRTEPGPGACEKCLVGTMQKQISLCGFSLAGSGWYKDGYSSKPLAKKAEKKEKTTVDK